MQSSQCLLCEHFHLDFKCDAFPDRIPHEIISGEVDHTEPYQGDNGIQFEPIPGIEMDEEDDAGDPAKEAPQKSIMAPSALDSIAWLNQPVEKEKARDYKKEYREYHGKPKQRKGRAERNAARAKLGLKVGDPREADHKNPISAGGSNSTRNLRAVSRGTNRHKADKT